jgi:glycosyltransferase involved in cell wall biosynthesis
MQAVTVHDISFFRFPQWFSTKERLSRQVNTSISLRQAERIYTVSEYVKREVAGKFRIPQNKILVTPNGVSLKAIDPVLRERLRSSLGLSDARIVLYVGSIFNRRRLPALIEAMKQLDPSYRLFLIGENRTHPVQDLSSEARRHGVFDRVKILEYVSDSVLEEYYRMADVLVYLSEYEGFGIPPLEAMSYGVPAVISETPAMNTIFQGAAVAAEDFSAAAVAKAIRSAVSDSMQRDRLIRAGLELAARYSWDETASIISKDWEQILATGG